MFPACGTCERLIHAARSGSLPKSTWHDHHPTIDSLAEAIDAGCSICLVFLGRGLSLARNLAANDPASSTVFWFCENEEYSESLPARSLLIDISLRAGGAHGTIARRFLLTLKEDIRCLRGAHEVVNPSSTSSDAALETAKKWLRGCRQNHSTCERAVPQASRRYLPTRLLDIRCQPNSGWRLVLDTKLLPDKTDYMTLSHRWGLQEFLNLTTETMPLFVAGMPLKSLPQTFQDAIYVVQKLGCEYLWIDALCILQGSDERALHDWRAESGAMRNVYAHSRCNIAATRASNCYGGLFSPRVSADICPLKVCFQDREGLSEEYVLHNTEFWRDHVEKSPLIERAWVLQERLLAPRTLHFAHKQLFFECNETNACESFPGGMPAVFFGVRRASLKVGSVFTRETIMNGINPVGVDEHLLWDSVVSAYAGYNLTKPDDKLVALSGIASMLQAVTRDNYYAGMWGSRFCTQLLWSILGCRRSNFEPSERPSQYRAPSWSWASVDGTMHWAQVTLDRPPFSGALLKVLSVETIPVTTEITGQLSGGFCLLCGVLREANILTDSTGNSDLIMDGKPGLFHMVPDVIMAEGTAKVACLPVGQYALSSEIIAVEGLVLMREKGSEETFSRIGLFRSKTSSSLAALGIELGEQGSLGTWCANTCLQTIKIV